jgi:hypothetical protein
MKTPIPWSAVTAVAAITLAAPAVAPADAVDDCLAQARARAVQSIQDGATDQAARRRLEIVAARCHDPALPRATARFIGTVNYDRARFALDLLQGHMTLAQYQAAAEDRRRKLQAHRDDLPYHLAVRRDRDRDLVPDRSDRCPGTPFGQPTDDRGCPVVDPRPPGDDDLFRRLLTGAKTIYNPSCKEAPRPLVPLTLEWGRGQQTKHGTTGFNLAVTKVGGMPPGCELFYEIQFRFIDPAQPQLPPSLRVSVAYSATEDLLADPLRAVFGLPLSQPLSPGRTQAREAFNTQYLRVSWRVRAVTGSGVASPWSPYVTQGPASGGVDG